MAKECPLGKTLSDTIIACVYGCEDCDTRRAYMGENKRIKGTPVDKDGNPINYENELDYYHECQTCKKMVDKRYLAEIIFHAEKKCHHE